MSDLSGYYYQVERGRFRTYNKKLDNSLDCMHSEMVTGPGSVSLFKAKIDRRQLVSKKI